MLLVAPIFLFGIKFATFLENEKEMKKYRQETKLNGKKKLRGNQCVCVSLFMNIRGSRVREPLDHWMRKERKRGLAWCRNGNGKEGV